MSFWQILGKFAFSDKGETLLKLSDTTSISSDGTSYTRMGSSATGLGAVFNDPSDDFGVASGKSRRGFDDF